MVEIDEPPTKKIRECGATETQLSLILVIVTSCLIFPINICKFVLHEKLIKMRGDYVLIYKGDKSLKKEKRFKGLFIVDSALSLSS